SRRQRQMCIRDSERLLSPTVLEEGAEGWSLFELTTAGPTYRFRAQRLPLDHLHIAPDSVTHDGSKQGIDAVAFIGHVREKLGLRPDQLPLYLEEVLSTLHGHAYKAARATPAAHALARADFQTIEQAMTEGHPCFIANNGRIGFDAGDYRAYAPEAGSSFCLMWLAGHRTRTEYAGMEDLPYETLISEELDAQTRAEFDREIRERGADPADYQLIPVHPWQWFNKLATVFSSEIATGHLICLGYGPDQYLAQQSVRTMFNVTEPGKRYVKTALSILNMGFMRGLPRYYLGSAPPMAKWLENRLYADPYLQERGFRMLSEVAAVSYENPYFAEFGPHDDYNKMLASLWRESPTKNLGPSEQAMTMAALLQVDEGGCLLAALVERSRLGIGTWLDAYLKAYLSPLLHCFFAHDLVFMPHGENVILVLDDGVPRRIFIKDITEEAAILSDQIELPENLERMRVLVDDDIRPLSIFIDIFDDFFRPLAAVIHAHTDVSASDFWERVAGCIESYQRLHPEDDAKHRRFDLFTATFELSCLNRLQLRNHRRMLDLDEPTGALQFAGPIDNPIAGRRRGQSEAS
ncbi:MAG: transcriptional regulator, partial [Nannocystaceae bacterium]|nr:transcriptional regulator [Nannocystaceae bacterium]